MVNEKIKLMLVDDSSLVRKVLKSVFAKDPEIDVVEEAEDGLVALRKIKDNKLDMVLLDYEMPNMNGLQVLKTLQNDKTLPNKPPIIVFSSLTNKGSQQTIDCLLAGAKDYIPKPSRSISGAGSLDEISKVLREKIISIVGSRRNLAMPSRPVVKPPSSTPTRLRDPGLLVIGSSTGGPAALEVLLKSLGSNFPYPILITQHMPEAFTTILAQSLSRNTNIPVQEVLGPTKIEKGRAYLAPGGKHMFMKDPYTVDVKVSAPVNFCIPSVDVMFESVAKVYNRGVISVMLTGMGRDGRDGVAELKQSLSCYSIAQDQASSVVWAMPRAVYEAGLSDELLPLDKIGESVLNVGYSRTR